MATVAVRGGYLGKDGSRLFYEERGQGPVVVLIHDGLLHSETWEGQWEAFSAGHRVIRYDRRSYGRSDLATEPYSDLEDLNALMQHLGVTRDMILCGNGSDDIARRAGSVMHIVGNAAADVIRERPGLLQNFQ